MARWNYVVASVIGTSHEQTSKPCQDYALCQSLQDKDNNPVLIAIASDGAGSAELSQIGSQMACKSLFKEAQSYLATNTVNTIDQVCVVNWVATVIKEISEIANSEGRKIRDYACTLLAAIIGENFAAYIQIGDGAIVVSEGGESDWSWIFWPQKGEFANTTSFLSDENAVKELQFSSGNSVKEVALFTDGIEKLVLDFASKSVFHRFFDQMFVAVRASQALGLDETLSSSLATYLASPLICERTDDDKSLIMATRKLAA